MDKRSIGDGNVVTGSCQNSNVEIQQNIVNLSERFDQYTDQKVAAYFAWVRHILTVDAGIIVLISALAQIFSVRNLICSVFMIASMCFLLLSLLSGVFCLIGETQFHNRKCLNVLQSIANQRRENKNFMEINFVTVQPIYAVFANRCLHFFSLALLSIAFYTIGYIAFNMFEKYWNFCLDIIILIVFTIFEIICWILFYSKIKEHGFDWNDLDKQREKIGV